MFGRIKEEGFVAREERILAFWEREQLFERSLKEAVDRPLFTFYDGPPFATGLPHYGHILAGIIKDVVPRFWSMRGYRVPRRFGWDCHGLPIENEIEKSLQLSGSKSIEEFGIARFNEACRAIVLRYTQEWKSTVRRMGRWVDFDHAYRTMDLSFMESVWWVFGELYRKGLIYEGFKVMPYSTRLATPISNFESHLNYQELDDPSLLVAFSLEEADNTYLVIWTTTPWTLPSNLAIAVHPDFNYLKICDLSSGKYYLVAEARVAEYFNNYRVEAMVKGESLRGRRYRPLFPYFVDQAHPERFQIVTDSFVSADEGTGLVHLAPGFGEVDFFVCQREGIESVCPIDPDGRYRDEIVDYRAIFVKDADPLIIERLKKEGRLLYHGSIRHRYPCCWRSDTPLIYRTVKSWFVAVEKIRERLIEANGRINWVPDHIKEGRFGKWLQQARDWCISRNRYWGTPIPLWRSRDGEVRVIASVRELEERSGQKLGDLHRPFVDEITFMEGGKLFRRIPELFDCWFESGSMPYAEGHFPFDSTKLEGFPADFIGEGLDQTRGWFYTLTILSVALFDQPAFKNVVVNGILLAEDGNKMSKRLKNYPEPSEIMNRYGADALRLYLLTSSAVVGEDLSFSAEGVELVLRRLLIPFWNSYLFLATYSSVYRWVPSLAFSPPGAQIDRWILSLVQGLIAEVREAMEQYRLQEAVAPLFAFVDQLTNWYIRRNRSRFWSEIVSQDREDAFATLYRVIHLLVHLAAPFIPFLSDAIYRELRMEHEPISVHLSGFPVVQSELCDLQLEEEMKQVQEIVALGHAVRKEHKIKVRQPLSKLYIISTKISPDLVATHRELISDELNVRAVEVLQEEGSFLRFRVKPNFRLLGKRMGALVEPLRNSMEQLPESELKQLLEGRSIQIAIGGERISIAPEEVEIERRVKEGMVAKTAAGVTVAFDIHLTDSLISEGIARELINKINTMRRELKFDLTDRIRVKIESPSQLKEAFYLYEALIRGEVLATEVIFGSCPDGKSWEINGYSASIEIEQI